MHPVARGWGGRNLGHAGEGDTDGVVEGLGEELLQLDDGGSNEGDAHKAEAYAADGAVAPVVGPVLGRQELCVVLVISATAMQLLLEGDVWDACC